MARTEQRRQKQLAKRKSKQAAKRKLRGQQRQLMASLSGRMKVASRGEVVHCLVSDAILDGGGMGSVLISRRMPNGELAVARFLIDQLCLGVKDCEGFSALTLELEDFIERVREVESLTAKRPSYARKLVEDAVAYADQFGLKPHADYTKLQEIWGDIDPSECTEVFRFGDDEGKPLYMSGPHDEPFFQQMVINKLTEHAGEGNFNFICQFSPDDSNETHRQLRMVDWSSEDDESEYDDLEQEHDGEVVLEGSYRRIDASE